MYEGIGTKWIFLACSCFSVLQWISCEPSHWKNNTSTLTELYCRTGYALQILPNGTVLGNIGRLNGYGSMAVTSRKMENGPGSMTIRGTSTNMYLCMNRESVIYSRKDFKGEDCVWVEMLLPTWYSAYRHRYHHQRRKRFYLGININGTMLHGNVTRKSRRTAMFLRLPIRSRSVSVFGPISFKPIPLKSTIYPTTSVVQELGSAKPKKYDKLGCKGLKSIYCKRMRQRRLYGKPIRHAKRHRRCRTMRREKLKQRFSAKQLRRLERRCKRIRRKRLERRRVKYITSDLEPKRTDL